jgi:hypothetical protein
VASAAGTATGTAQLASSMERVVSTASHIQTRLVDAENIVNSFLVGNGLWEALCGY